MFDKLVAKTCSYNTIILKPVKRKFVNMCSQQLSVLANTVAAGISDSFVKWLVFCLQCLDRVHCSSLIGSLINVTSKISLGALVFKNFQKWSLPFLLMEFVLILISILMKDSLFWVECFMISRNLDCYRSEKQLLQSSKSDSKLNKSTVFSQTAVKITIKVSVKFLLLRHEIQESQVSLKCWSILQNWFV